MSRNIATTIEHAPAFQPTAEDCDAVLAALDGPDSEATVTVSPEDRKRLLASAFALSLENEGPRPSTDDEITLEAPSPGTKPAVRMTQRPAAPPLHLRSLPRGEHHPRAVAVDTRAYTSGVRARVMPDLARAAREARHEEESVPQAAWTESATLLQQNPQLLVVAGIWAMALSLCAMLALMATG